MNLPIVYFLVLWHLAPVRGLATWYGPPRFNNGDIMRNGAALDLTAPTVAVDASHANWLDKTAVILTGCGGIHFVRITDTGYLEQTKGGEPLLFRLGVSVFTKTLRYWPVVDATPVLTSTVEWQEDEVYSVVADFPRDFFMDEVACDQDETLKVRMYVR